MAIYYLFVSEKTDAEDWQNKYSLRIDYIDRKLYAVTCDV